MTKQSRYGEGEEDKLTKNEKKKGGGEQNLTLIGLFQAHTVSGMARA